MSEEKILQTENLEPIAEEEAELLSPEEMAAQAKTKWLTAVADEIRGKSQKEKTYLSLSALLEATGATREEFLAETADMKEREEFADICIYQGAKDAYYYSYPTLAHNYVRACVLAAEDDLCATIADVVRYESKTYPRATNIDTFARFPYHYSAEQVKEKLAMMQEQAQYADLQSFVSEREKIFYIYSTKFMTEKYAKALVDMYEDKRNWM